jgi:pyruvate kinase
MKTNKKLEVILTQIEKIIRKAEKLEVEYTDILNDIHSEYRESSFNLLHYLAFRSFENGELQQHLRYQGLPDLANIEGHVMKSLVTIQNIIEKLLSTKEEAPKRKSITIKKSEKILRKNTGQLFGSKSNNRSTRIMVTLPAEAASNYQFVNQLMQNGMNTARINCAHDDEAAWSAMIENIKKSSKNVGRKCKIMMDLGGPKLRTGSMQEGPKVVHIKPRRDSLGKVIQPALVWIAPPDVPSPTEDADATIPVSNIFIEKIRRGNVIYFTDSRGKKCRMKIIRKQGKGQWALCSDSAYITTGTELILHKVKETGKEKNFVGELLPSEQFITLYAGDNLILHRNSRPGEPARFDSRGNLVKPAHISCTMPEIFEYVKIDEPIYLNDGKIEGLVRKVTHEELEITITHASAGGSKLKADKGINFPETNLAISGLTETDRKDLSFVVKNADAVNLSFVNQPSDVKELQKELKKHEASIGIVLKIETRKGFVNLPKILFQAMQTYPLGIMVARGDLAIETGWENFATIQEEIMRLGEAAHIPVIWATQVLESLAKKGVPTRSEITDAALAQRAECVMLNKGQYIGKALKTLNEILIKMQNHQKKRQTVLPKLKDSEGLNLIYAQPE